MGRGIVQRHLSGSWRRIWGAIRSPRASAAAAMHARSPAAIRQASRVRRRGQSSPSTRQQAEGDDPADDCTGREGGAAAATVQRRPPSPARPTVSTIENPHGDQAPVSPIRSAAAARLSSSGLIASASGVRSARDVGLVVGDAEDLAAAVAVALQGGVAVDPVVMMGAAVPELPDASPAAPVPGALRDGRGTRVVGRSPGRSWCAAPAASGGRRDRAAAGRPRGSGSPRSFTSRPMLSIRRRRRAGAG